jgi:proteasome assembly chaperone (PAC2) family protein
MGIKYIREPEMSGPVMIASWPGIGNIGVIAVDVLRRSLRAEHMAYIEPQDFFYPNKVIIRGGELVELGFPSSEFYYHRGGRHDLIFFLGQEQPAEGGGVYATGGKAYAMANLVLDAAEKFGCRRIYTSGAAVTPMHHTGRSRVWAVPNSAGLLGEFKAYQNTVLMSDIEGRGGEGNITGLNGLLLGIARRRGLEAVCLMGEIPVYLQGFPFPYPKGSKSVLEVLSQALGMWIDMERIDRMAQESEEELTGLYEKLPQEIKQQLDQLKHTTVAAPESGDAITDDDKKKILDDLDRFFKRESGGGQG